MYSTAYKMTVPGDLYVMMVSRAANENTCDISSLSVKGDGSELVSLPTLKVNVLADYRGRVNT